jgi:hypothetical protein
MKIILHRLLSRIVIWWKANMLDYPYWRVTYKDGKQTSLLYWREASNLKDVFNGKLWIDYKYLISRYFLCNKE